MANRVQIIENILEVFEYNQHFVAMMNIINFAKLNPPKEGHKHHIIPRCWFKMNNLPVDNSKDNLVLLTYEDHVNVHKLAYLCALTSKFKGKMAYAYHRLTQGEVVANGAFAGEHNSNYGKHHKLTDEARQRISIAMRNYIDSHPEYIEGCRKRSTGRKYSEESRLKKSKSLKGRVFNDEWRAKLSEAAKRRVARNGGYAVVK